MTRNLHLHPFYTTLLMILGLFETASCTLSSSGGMGGKGDIYNDINVQGVATPTDTLSINAGSPDNIGR